MKFNAIILAGGKSSRMGSDKALLKLDGKTLLQGATDICEPICERILISSNNPDHGLGKYTVISDEFPDCGPMSGIYSCLKKSIADWNFVISVDAPFVEKDFVEFLFEGIPGYDAVVPVHEGKKEPLIALYHKNSLPVFEKQLKAGNFKMHFLLEQLQTNFMDASDWLEQYPRIFENLNYPGDLR